MLNEWLDKLDRAVFGFFKKVSILIERLKLYAVNYLGPHERIIDISKRNDVRLRFWNIIYGSKLSRQEQPFSIKTSKELKKRVG